MMKNKTKKHAISMKCRLCDSTQLELSLNLPNSPRRISRLLKVNQLMSDHPLRFKVYSCQVCGFIQAPNTLKDDYYDEFPMTWSHSSQMKVYRTAQVKTLVKRFNLKNKRLIEIGCGDGDYLEILNKAGVKGVGIEPSLLMRKIALAKGIKVYPGYVGQSKKMPGGPYDAFVTRQVLEHIADMHGFLQSIRASLKVGSIGLVEVPNTHKDLAYHRFYNFYPDHLGFFTMRTLSFLLERNGFTVLNVGTGMDDEFLEAHVRLDPVPNLAPLQKTVQVLGKNIQSVILKAKKENKKIAVWGAGYKGNMLLAVAKVKQVEYVVDSDPSKHGLYTPVSHLPVVSPAYLHEHPVDIMVVTTMTYVKEVVGQIKQSGFKGKILTLYQLSQSSSR